MTLAIWDITTITSNALNLHFGISARWEEIPDMFPPIGFMFTSTTPAARAQLSTYGLFVEYVGTTSAAMAGSKAMGMPHFRPMRVRAYQKGTRWFIIGSQAAAGSGLIDANLTCTPTIAYPIKRLILYYRALDESGEVPA